jgi:hypothetical protein
MYAQVSPIGEEHEFGPGAEREAAEGGSAEGGSTDGVQAENLLT